MLVADAPSSSARAVDDLARKCGVDVDATKELARTWARLWVALPRRQAPPVGFLLAWHVADEVHLINVATHPDHRRRGIARQLMQTLLEFARRSRARLLVLEVRRSNRGAIQLYRAHGFSAMGIRRAYYADNGEDAVEMVLALDPETGHIRPGRDEVRLGEHP